MSNDSLNDSTQNACEAEYQAYMKREFKTKNQYLNGVVWDAFKAGWDAKPVLASEISAPEDLWKRIVSMQADLYLILAEDYGSFRNSELFRKRHADTLREFCRTVNLTPPKRELVTPIVAKFSEEDIKKVDWQWPDSSQVIYVEESKPKNKEEFSLLMQTKYGYSKKMSDLMAGDVAGYGAFDNDIEDEAAK